MRGGVTQRRRAIARGVECLHVSQGDARAVGVLGREAGPPLDGLARTAAGHRPVGEALERLPVAARKAGALAVGPVGELLRAGVMEPGEEGSAVGTHRPLQLFSSHRRLELPEIAGQPLGVEPEVLASGEDGVVTQRRAEDVERFAEEMAGVGGVALGPEPGHQPVAAERAGVLDREQRQQGEALPQGGPARHGAVGTVERSATEEPKCEHRRELRS